VNPDARSVNTDVVRSMNNAPLLAKFEYTAPLEKPARPAIISSDALAYPRSRNTSRAAARMSARTSARLGLRLGPLAGSAPASDDVGLDGSVVIGTLSTTVTSTSGIEKVEFTQVRRGRRRGV